MRSSLTLKKVEQILHKAGYLLRYEKGTFQSGYCILDQRKIIVINKFLSTDARIDLLESLIVKLIPQAPELPSDLLVLYHQIVSPKSPS